MVKNNVRGQSLSTDVLVVIVLVLFGALFLVINQITQEEQTDLDKRAEQATAESRIIIDRLANEGIIDDQSNVDVDLLLTIDEEQLRRELNIQNEFAIVFEKDGRLVRIDPENQVNCVGSSNIVINGVECS